MLHLVIRRLEVADAPILQDCRLAALLAAPDAFVATHAEVVNTPLAAVMAELSDPDNHYVGAFAGRLVGFARFVRPARAARRHVAEVRSVFVDAAWRRQHVAHRLLARLIEDARTQGLESLTLAVLADNLAARRLYESLGFELIGTEPRAVRKARADMDLLHYWRALAGG